MLFNSIQFAIFLPIVFMIYWIIPAKFRWGVLLISSYYFYMSWNPKYIVLIVGTTLVSYIAAILLEKCGTLGQKKCVIVITLLVCLGVLFVFKYLNFALETLYMMMSKMAIPMSKTTVALTLPVGISFYTFQTLSYVIDVYRGEVKAEKHLGQYAAFISFFPQLVAGPIERTRNLLIQVKEPKKFSEEKAFEGVRKMIWGFYKKMVVADAIGKIVDDVYSNLSTYSGGAIAIAVFLFTIQIYCDFSGYSDIAIGTAKLFNIDLMENFKSPYFAVSLHDFWSRWHISLSTWFRDYLYIPLGGNRRGSGRKRINLIITFLVSGLWHGADWTYVLWGGVHGLGQVIENIFDNVLRRVRKTKLGRFIIGIIVFVFCNLAWVLFRAENISDAVYVYLHIFSGITDFDIYISEAFSEISWKIIDVMYYFSLIGLLGIVDFCNKEGILKRKIGAMNKMLRWLIFLALAVITVILAQKGEAAEFVYFQF